MIVLDTNVISEFARLRPSAAVMEWFTGQDERNLFITAVSEAELRVGVAILPAGRRRDQLSAVLDTVVSDDFAGRIVPFDSTASKSYAAVVAGRRAAGRPISFPDAQIAAIARAHRATVATRNTRDFEGCGVELVNPWLS